MKNLIKKIIVISCFTLVSMSISSYGFAKGGTLGLCAKCSHSRECKDYDCLGRPQWALNVDDKEKARCKPQGHECP